MENRRIPVFTLALLMTAIALHGLAPDPALLYFNAANIRSGETWRLLTGHFMHADKTHLFWNGLGLVVLGTLIEHRSRLLLLATLGAGIAAVSILLMTPFAELDYYCGLSGALNSLLLVAIWLEWQATRSWLVIAIALGCVVKVVVEVSQGTSILTHISWPPYAWSHLAGLAGGLVVAWQWRKVTRLQPGDQNAASLKNTIPGHHEPWLSGPGHDACLCSERTRRRC